MNKLFLFLVSALLMYPLAGFPADHAVRGADLAALKDLDQARMDALKDSLTKDLQIQSARLDAQDKRLDQQDKLLESFSERIGDLSMFLTLFGVVAGLVGYFTVRNRAQQEAKVAAAEWLETNGKEAIKEKLEELDLHIDSQKKAAVERFEQLYNNAATQISEMQNQMGTAPMSWAQEASLPEQAVLANSDAITKLVEVLKHKPEAEYGFDDWNARAHDAFSKGKMALAAEYWLQAARGGNARGVQVAQSLFNAGVALTAMNRRDEALAVYDEAISRYGNAPELELRNQVAMALVNKSNILVDSDRSDEAMKVCDAVVSLYGNAPEITLSEQVARAQITKAGVLLKLGRYDDAISVTSALVSRYGSSPEIKLRQLVGAALNAQGFALFCRAKENWGRGTTRVDDLRRASELFTQAETQMTQSYFALGNQAYATFLLDQKEDAHRLLERALKQGGESLYKATLDDIGIHTIAPDTDFRALLDATWEAVRTGT